MGRETDSVAFDGRSLLPLLKGQAVDWPDRTYYVQWHRGDIPELHRAFAARSDRYKLVQPKGVEPLPLPEPLHYELYDMIADPLEQNDIAEANPEIVARMLQGYDAWFADVRSTRNFAHPRIHLGSPVEDPTTLTRQDWRGPETAWEPGEMGGWDVDVRRTGKFDLDLVFVKGPPGTVHFELAGTSARSEIGQGSRTCRIEGVTSPKAPARLRAWIDRPNGAVGVYQVISIKNEPVSDRSASAFGKSDPPPPLRGGLGWGSRGITSDVRNRWLPNVESPATYPPPQPSPARGREPEGLALTGSEGSWNGVRQISRRDSAGPGAIAELRGRDSGPLEHREVQIIQGRLLGIDEVPAALDRAAALAGEEDRQVVVVVAVAVADPAAVDDHRMVEERPFALTDRPELLEQVGELLDVEAVDLLDLGLLRRRRWPWCERSWWPSGTPMSCSSWCSPRWRRRRSRSGSSRSGRPGPAGRT